MQTRSSGYVEVTKSVFSLKVYLRLCGCDGIGLHFPAASLMQRSSLIFGLVSSSLAENHSDPTQNVKMFSPFIEELKCKDRSLPMKQKAVKSSFLLSFTWWWFLALSLLGNGVLLILSVVRLIQIMVSNDNASVLLPALYCIPALPFWECTRGKMFF